MQSLHHQLKELIVSELALSDVRAEEIESDTPLFGEGLALDSIDALELAMAIDREFGVRINSDDAEQRAAMATVNDLARYIETHRTADA